ncbi:MAG: tetratricopeptide repeat protein [Kofleriaceae bacterium]|nr:tetratricopeptide repeat protein [Kofleriaceae bacterium]
MADTPGLQGDFDRFEQHLVAGSELLRQSRIRDAQAQLLSALQVQPGNPRALALLGLAYFRGGQFDDAMPIYRALVERQPEDASFRLNLGLVYLKVGEAKLAIGELERCREIDPGQSRALSYLGLAYTRAGQFAEAYQAFLTTGQEELAEEVVHHLSDAERQAIEAAVQRPADSELSQPSIQIQVVRDAEAPAAAPAAAAPVEAPAPEAAAPAAAVAETPVADDEIVFEAEAAARPNDAPAPVEASPSARVIMPQSSQTAISRAVAQATPHAAVAQGGTKVSPGGRPAQPLSEFATARLVRPEDGDHTFEIGAAGVLIVRVDGRLYTRTEGVDVTGGDLSYQPAHRRVRGAQTDELFTTGERQLYVVSGKGHLIAGALGGEFTAVQLDDDIFYLREDVVFAFEPSLKWENGHVPGSAAKIPMVQFRGNGAVAFRTPRPLLAVKLAPERILYVDANALAGWIGRVVPRVVSPAGTSRLSELFVECSGEGVVLVQDEPGPNLAVPVHVTASRLRAAEAAAAAATDAADDEPA